MPFSGDPLFSPILLILAFLEDPPRPLALCCPIRFTALFLSAIPLDIAATGCLPPNLSRLLVLAILVTFSRSHFSLFILKPVPEQSDSKFLRRFQLGRESKDFLYNHLPHGKSAG